MMPNPIVIITTNYDSKTTSMQEFDMHQKKTTVVTTCAWHSGSPKDNNTHYIAILGRQVVLGTISPDLNTST
ncbi:unnamed protein product [Ceratitis capitata]|uniref:(Mediterranean fruit fly) hypothetical protein n=1 Tax=Ceratitis capitata TaxID=7213 RepID=A0A811URP3_CERCA|nr:unnamed protein product [Ceratitis capitata]